MVEKAQKTMCLGRILNGLGSGFISKDQLIAMIDAAESGCFAVDLRLSERAVDWFTDSRGFDVDPNADGSYQVAWHWGDL